jgi:predicted ArsR family transcriptional regulator
MTGEDDALDAPALDADALQALGALTDPVRRRLYQAVAAAPEGLGREAAAGAAETSRSLAAFHLDKLVDAGLLAVSFRRLSGRSGPGAGRPAKVYRRAEAEHAVSVPPRAYDGVGRLLAEVVERAGLDRELQDVAREAGTRAAGDPLAALRARGYEPCREEAGGVRLNNCPFHALAEEFRALVCGMNLALVDGLVGEDGEWEAVIAAGTTGCCVALRPKESKNNAH